MSSLGYSGTPLAKKLGIVGEARVVPLHAPAEYQHWLQPLADHVVFQRDVSTSTDVVHLFCEQRSVLVDTLTQLRHSIRDSATVWVSWPKKSAKRATDVTEDVIRVVALPMGFVDVKVCAVSDVWSGLKLVIRTELRQATAKPRRATTPK